MTVMIHDQKQVLLAAVERIRPEVERGSDEGESLRTLPAATVRALSDSGLFSMKLPEVLGGMEADLITQYEVVEAMAYVDASAGWCLMIGATSIAIPGAYLPEAAIAEVFEDHRIPLAATSVLPTGCASRRSCAALWRSQPMRHSTS